MSDRSFSIGLTSTSGVMVEMTRAGRRATRKRSMSVLVPYRSRYSVDMASMFVAMDLARTDLADPADR
jgi:hypothetical protein